METLVDQVNANIIPDYLAILPVKTPICAGEQHHGASPLNTATDAATKARPIGVGEKLELSWPKLFHLRCRWTITVNI